MPAPELTQTAIALAHAAATQAGRPISVVTEKPDGSIQVDYFLPDPACAANTNPFPR
jgi:hypothetical protein